MHTITYELIGSEETESYERFKSRVFSLLESRSTDSRVVMLKVTLTTEAPPGFSVIPFSKNKIAAVQTRWSILPENDDLLKDGLIGSYRVSEAFPVQYVRNWPLGQRSPGACMLTLFRKRHDIGRETFIDRWHNGHTPLSLKIHPLWHYSRNVVESIISPEGLVLDGIVEEHTRTQRDLLNPFIFFGGAFRMIPNMIRTYFDVRSFLDYPSITPYLAAEYYLKYTELEK